MRTIGRSEENAEYIVIMSHQEYIALAKLIKAIEGKPIETWIGEVPQMASNSPDLSNALVAVRVFATTLAQANELSQLIDTIKQSLIKADG